ncbi:MAG: flagellar export protein FliJ [Planctomycetaceae bacterium]|nr:flagellar export protein FliJ [Planctomycetaceae bacterium]
MNSLAMGMVVMAEKFRLHSVLQLRRTHQEERQAELAQAVQAAQILHGQIGEVQQQLQEIEEQLRAASLNRVDVDHLMAIRRHQANTRALLRQLQEQQQVVEQEIERRQTRLVEANREVKVVETLEQQHSAAQWELFLKREQDALDEFAQKRVQADVE